MLSGIVARYENRSRIRAAGLYGCWYASRGGERDIYRILVVEDDERGYAVREAEAHGDNLFDFITVPVDWVSGAIKPDMDLILEGCHVLYDPAGLVGKSKRLMEGWVRSRGRCDVRTRMHQGNAEVCLSRAASAFDHQDTYSTRVYVDESLRHLSNIVVDLTGHGVYGDKFLWGLRRACADSGLWRLYKEFFSSSRLRGLELSRVEENVETLQDMWARIALYTNDNREVEGSIHPQVLADVEYRRNNAYRRTMIERLRGLVALGDLMGATFMMRELALPLLVNYGWFIFARKGEIFEYPRLFKMVRDNEFVPGIYDEALDLFDLRGVDRSSVWRGLEDARKLAEFVRESSLRLLARIPVDP